MSLQKKRKTKKDEYSYDLEELEDLGIYVDNDDESEDDDKEDESWKNYD
ncbi:MAG: hypothetical protein JSW62_00855 [Thermoplasmatales archaeon]|nr:MAG: hypothetical protein JSW62_00855 [Thermoplasmatales archaeon]